MKTIVGFNFSKNDFRYAVISNEDNPIKIIEKNKIILPNSMEVDELMEWFETQLSLIIDKHNPREISYKISLHLLTLDQIKNSCYPQAILNLIANKKNISIKSYSTQGIKPGKLGLEKNVNLYDYVDRKIGDRPPYWDKTMKDTVLVAWFKMLNK